MLKCLEGAAAYVYANSGCKKWDTAAPEAVLKAAGFFHEFAVFLSISFGFWVFWFYDWFFLFLGGNFTDVSGRLFYYGADAQVVNTGGIIATSNWVKHEVIVYLAFFNGLKK